MDWDSVDALGFWLGRWVAVYIRIHCYFTTLPCACRVHSVNMIGGLGLRHNRRLSRWRSSLVIGSW
jgi:hypothetical protein